MSSAVASRMTCLPDVALLVTELVANGVRHGGAHAGTELSVRFECSPRALHVEVCNPDHRHGAVGRARPTSTAAAASGCTSSSASPAAGA